MSRIPLCSMRATRVSCMNYATDFKSVRGSVSPEEWQTRVDLAACYRLMDCFEMTDLIYNHITARIPGTQDHLKQSDRKSTRLNSSHVAISYAVFCLKKKKKKTKIQ